MVEPAQGRRIRAHQRLAPAGAIGTQHQEPRAGVGTLGGAEGRVLAQFCIALQCQAGKGVDAVDHPPGPTAACLRP